MKKAIFISLAFAVALWHGCGNSNNESEHHHDDDSAHEHSDGESHHHTFMCPMNCENGKTYSEAGKCPKCGMNLEHKDDAENANAISCYMQFASNPEMIEAGKEGTLSFTPKIKGKKNQPVPLDVVHEKKLHLIIVSNDLAYFEHIHPEYKADGSYQINVLAKEKSFMNGRGHNETKFEFGGDYMLFADYSPTGGNHTLDKIPLAVQGISYNVITYNKEKVTRTIDGLTVSLEADGGKWTTGIPMHIKAIIKKGNQVLDANNFENYLGAKSHMVVLKTETFDYLHVHPEVENGFLDLHTTFESPGIYRAWLQFQTEGKLHAVDFVIKVEQGNETASSEKQDEHNHKH